MPVSGDSISSRTFKHLSSFIYDQCGIRMPAAKQTMVEGRLRRRARALQFDKLEDYCRFVLGEGAGGDEVVHLINAVTTNKTDFFREPRHFDYLAQTILPALAARQRRIIRAWSAACSTGAEPYTIAMVLDDFAQAHGGPDYAILATDLDTNVLATAHKGIYPREMIDPVPPRLRQRYVRMGQGARAGEARIDPACAPVGFAQLNLMEQAYAIGQQADLIFCRNVLIYFDKPTQKQVVSRLVDCLVPGGYLFVGHSDRSRASISRSRLSATPYSRGARPMAPQDPSHGHRRQRQRAPDDEGHPGRRPGDGSGGNAADPFAAARHLQEQVPDVITLDVEMPRMDGITFLRKLMQQCPVPVVMCSVADRGRLGNAAGSHACGRGGRDPQAARGVADHLSESRLMIRDTVKAAARAKVGWPSSRPASAPATLNPQPKLTADAVLPPPPTARLAARR
jgi:chemotaxis protein methyltransferase CheR